MLHNPRWRRRSNVRPHEILAAALEAFGEHGFAATRLDDIAKRAGISKGTLYLYYKNKEELFKAVVYYYMTTNLDRIESATEDHDSRTIDTLNRVLAEIGSMFIIQPSAMLPKIIIGESLNFPEMCRFYVDEVIMRIFRIIVTLHARGVERGEFRPLPPEALGPPLIGPLLLASIWKTALAASAPPLLNFIELIDFHHQAVQLLLLTDGGKRHGAHD